MPASAPISVPDVPMIMPSKVKILLMPAEVMPIAFNMPISLVFSTTITTSVLIILKEATSMIKVRMINIVSFSSFKAAKKF